MAQLFHRLVAEVLNRDGAQGGLRRGFPDNRIAGNRGEKRIPGPDGDRKVEGSEDADRPQRMPLLAHAMGRALGLHGGPVEHPGLADGEVGHVDHLLDFAVALRLDLADFGGYEGAELILLRSQGLADQAHERSALGSRDHPPGRKYFNRLMNNVFVIIGCARLHAGNDLAGRRIDGLQKRPFFPDGPPVRACAPSGIDGLDTQYFQRVVDGAHRKLAPKSLARKSFSRNDS